MKKNCFILLAAGLVFAASCNNVDYKKTKSGLLYKIITPSGSKDTLVKPGNMLKLFFQQKINDSLLQSNYGKLPTYAKVEENVGAVYDPREIFTMLHKGDSVVSVILVDSLIKKGLLMTMPPFMHKGDRLYIYFKIVDVFYSDSLARNDNEREMTKEMARQKKEMEGKAVEEAKEVETYLASKKITTQKTEKGTYVQILETGQGAQIDSGKYVTVKYKGSTFNGKVFDTNMDTTFHHAEAYSFVVGAGQMIQGFDDGIRLLKKGGHANLYIPAVLAYGPQSPSPDIKPYENLIFEVSVVDVQDKAPVQNRPRLKLDTTQRKK
jgi:FKBP-type peptidyl-prolyl cis-trans isomerase